MSKTATQILPASQIHQIRLLIRQVGQQAKRMAGDTIEVAQKGPGDFVTSVDRFLDRQLATRFAAWFPEDGIITEENAASVLTFSQSFPRFWFIDPIDGTADFIQGRPNYAVMVGLLQNYQPVAGWIYSPARDLLYYGGPTWGLFQAAAAAQPYPLFPVEPAVPSLNFCPILIGPKDAQQYGQAIHQLIPEAQFYFLGSFGLKVMAVITGQAGLYLYLNRRVKLWDTIGPLALAQAAGLVCCDLKGEALKFTPNAIDPQSLAHRQTILVGWPEYIEYLRPRLQAAIAPTLS